jgi:hypothetical protein
LRNGKSDRAIPRAGEALTAESSGQHQLIEKPPPKRQQTRLNAIADLSDRA